MHDNGNRQFRGNSVHSGYDDIRGRAGSCNTDETIALIENFLRLSPDHAEAHNDLAVYYYRSGNKLQTLGHYERAFKLSPRNITFAKNLASFYFVEMGWTDDAILIYTDILKAHPADTETLVSLGIISSAVGRPDEAVIFLRRALDLEPWNDEARLALESIGCTGREPHLPAVDEPADSPAPPHTSDMEQLLAGLRETITRLENNPPEDSHEKAEELAARGKTEEAVSMLERIAKRNPHDGLVHNDLGVLYLRLGDTARSIEHHELALANSPRNATFRKHLANLYYTAAGRTDDAIMIFVELLREYPNDCETLEALAIISSDMGRPEEASVFLRKIIEIDPSNSYARSLLSEMESRNEGGFFLAAR